MTVKMWGKMQHKTLSEHSKCSKDMEKIFEWLSISLKVLRVLFVIQQKGQFKPMHFIELLNKHPAARLPWSVVNCHLTPFSACFILCSQHCGSAWGTSNQKDPTRTGVYSQTSMKKECNAKDDDVNIDFFKNKMFSLRKELVQVVVKVCQLQREQN